MDSILIHHYIKEFIIISQIGEFGIIFDTSPHVFNDLLKSSCQRTSNYFKRMTLLNITPMMSMVERVAIGMETPKIDSKCSLKKEFNELICINPWMVLKLIFSQVDSCHSYVCSLLT